MDDARYPVLAAIQVRPTPDEILLLQANNWIHPDTYPEMTPLFVDGPWNASRRGPNTAPSFVDVYPRCPSAVPLRSSNTYRLDTAVPLTRSARPLDAQSERSLGFPAVSRRERPPGFESFVADTQGPVVARSERPLGFEEFVPDASTVTEGSAGVVSL